MGLPVLSTGFPFLFFILLTEAGRATASVKATINCDF
jgi:hypothetical protein